MKIALLTTQTIHHTWYLQKLKEAFPSVFCVIETTSIKSSFEVTHPFEEERESIESDYFFSRKIISLKEISPFIEVENINDEKVLYCLNNFKPDILILFGTRKISSKLLSTYKNRLINLHGGDPETYRGLDSHLWAIYHADWFALITTLHTVNENLDDGLIVQKKSLDLLRITSLHELRFVNTQACVDLSIAALKTYQALGKFITSQQQRQGKYYSFMPTALKEVCFKNFAKYLGTIKQNEN